MDTPFQTSASTQSFKSRKKLPLSPSTRKSWVQILTTLFITFFIVGGVAYLENEQKKDKCEYKFNISTIICLVSDSKLLGQLQNIGVLSAALLFFWDTFDRKKQLERQAWQLIDGAQGSETSGARKLAIEDLYQEGADITGLDADGADLRGINLSGADLTGASFKNAILKEANFEGAILREANFERANLEGADLSDANLWGADLTGADLCRAKLKGTNLSNATLNKVDLCQAEFGEYKGKSQSRFTNLTAASLRRANIQGVDLTEVDISNAHFGGARTGKDSALNIDILRQAKNNSYKEAEYDENVCSTYPRENLKLDIEYDKQERNRKNRDEKIEQIKNRIFIKLQNEDNSSVLPDLLDALIEILPELGQESNSTSESKDLRNEAIAIRDKLKQDVNNAKQILPLVQSERQELDKKQQDADQEKLILEEQFAALIKQSKSSPSEEITDEQDS